MNNNDILHVFTTATGPYKAFFKNFFITLNNFFPNNRKILHIYADDISEIKKFTDKDVTIILTKILDLPHPLVALQKTFIQKRDIDETMKYVFYFDIDTMFVKKSDEFWNFISDKIDSDMLIMSKHPHYDAKPELIENLVEKNKLSKAYIPEDYHMHVISSFWGGKKDIVLKMCNYVNDMLKYDVWALRYLPRFVDENYINKLIWQTKNNEISDLSFYIDEHMVMIPGWNFNIPTPNIFLIQKYDNMIKNEKKIV